jgi:hypothetical protein
MLNKTLSRYVLLVKILNKYRMEQSQRKLLDDWMAEENIELELNTIRMVDRCHVVNVI